jgi:hypothetical protein
MLPRGLKLGERYVIRKPALAEERERATVYSFQYPFKPPIDERKAGRAVTMVAFAPGDTEENTSWTVHLPAKVTTKDNGKDSSSKNNSKHLKRGAAMMTGDDEGEREGDDDENLFGEKGEEEASAPSSRSSFTETSRDEVFVGESGRSKNEFLLTWRYDGEEGPSAAGGSGHCFDVEKVSSITRLKHVTAVVNGAGDNSKSKERTTKRMRTNKGAG